MLPLDKDLQKKKNDLSEFLTLSVRILDYLPNVISKKEIKNSYIIYSSSIAGSIKYLRPINSKLFIDDPKKLIDDFHEFTKVITRLKNRELEFDSNEKFLIDSVLYTISQSIGAGFDLLVNSNSARKHVGNRFEELIKCIFTEIGVTNKRSVLQIPYKTHDGVKIYKCENDLILSPYTDVKSCNKSIHPDEIVVSVKTTSKDRMGKMFVDKILLEKFVGHPIKVLGIFLNDVQRKEYNNISFTLVSGLFMVYTDFLTKLEGVYYLDPPPNAFKEPFKHHMNTFSNLLCKDIWNLLTP